MVKLFHTSSWSLLGSSILDLGWDEVPQEGSDFTLSRERVCVSLSINTWRLDWTHLESLAVNEREPEVTRLYRPIIICLGGTSKDPPQHQLAHAGNQLLTLCRLIWTDHDPDSGCCYRFSFIVTVNSSSCYSKAWTQNCLSFLLFKWNENLWRSRPKNQQVTN